MRHRRSSSTRRAEAGVDAQARKATPRAVRRSVGRTTLFATFVALLALALPSLLAGATTVTATATFVVRDVDTNAVIPEFTYLVSVDNAARRTDPVTQRAGVKPTPSYIPIVGAGDNTDPTADLDAPGRYLVTVKAPGYKLWGQHFDLTGNQTVDIELKAHPLPLGKLIVHAFNDRQPVNAAPDAVEVGLEGFEVRLHDTVDEMQADYNGDPLCGGQCLTDAEGNVTIENLAPGRYEIEVLPPDGTDWRQTTTFEGTHLIDFGRVTENDNGLGALDERGIVGGIQTAWWFGFVEPLDLPATCSPCGSITGIAKTWVGFPPYNELLFGDPVSEPIVALSNVGQADEQVYTGFGNPDNPGEFLIENIPDGSYQLAIFDENLDYIIRYVNFTLPDPVSGSRDLNLNTPDVNGELGVAVARWFGWQSGFVFEDTGLDVVGTPIAGATASDGIRDCDPVNPLRCEEGIDGIDLDLRFRDGSVKTSTFTAPNAVTSEAGYYEYPELLNPLSRFMIAEVGFGRFARTGASLHDQFNPAVVAGLPSELGGQLLLNYIVAEGHRSWIDWGKREYAPSEHGGITGIVFHATTRNEFDPSLGAAEDYEPAIPNATVKLYGPGPDGVFDVPGTPSLDDVVINEVETDAWSHPRSDHPDLPQSCTVFNALGAVLPAFVPNIAANCIEFPTLSNQTKDGAFDGGYAIETMVADPDTGSAIPETLLEVNRDYLIEVVPPPFYQVMKEEDQNTDEGDTLEPQFPPPPCVGPLHLVNDPRNPANGTQKPLCTKKLVTLEDGQNPAADFFLFTDVDDDPTTNTAADGSWNTVESIAPPGRIFGLVADDLRFETDPTSPWYGQPIALPNIPVGVYDFTGRLITMLHTDEHGFYDVTLPSSQTYNCPTPSGVCPGMYVLRIDDPSDPAFNPDFLTAALAFDVWPGKTTYADTPVDPISALACTLGPAPEGQAQQPEFFRVSNPYITRNASTANQAQRELTIDGAGFGTAIGTLGQVTLDGNPLPAAAILAWGDRQISVRVPQNFIAVGPRQLLIRGASGVWTPLGITIHVRQTGSAYNPPIVNVTAAQSIQAAIDSAGTAAGTLIVVRPGTHVENVILHKRVKLQGVGPGGTVGSLDSTAPDDIRFTIVGSVINARNFFDREAAWNTLLNTLKTTGTGIVGNQGIPGGAAITVVARATGQFSGMVNRAMIDGLGITLGQSMAGGAGGIQVNAWGTNMWISNNILENNGGGIGGGIALGTPSTFAGRTGPADNNNDDIRIAYNRILGNGALTNGGGVAIYNGADRYLIERNQICSNYSVTYGAGIGQFGLMNSNNSDAQTSHIRENHLYGNEAFDSGGAIALSGELPVVDGGLGTGRVDIRRNYVWFNLSNDDGGGMFIRDTAASQINLASNIIANNVATDVGGGVALDDVPGARIMNNTVVRNSSTDTAEDRDGIANGAGLVSERNDSGTGFSNPVAFFNNIFWENEAFTFDPTGDPEGGGPALISAGFFDVEVLSAAGVFSPRFSMFTQADNANFTPHASNQIGVDPQFVSVYVNEIRVDPTQFGPAGEIQTLLFRADPPPPFKEGAPGDYHLTAGSPALTLTGGAVSQTWQAPTVPAPRCDIDRQQRASATAPAPRGADRLSTEAPVNVCVS